MKKLYEPRKMTMKEFRSKYEAFSKAACGLFGNCGEHKEYYSGCLADDGMHIVNVQGHDLKVDIIPDIKPPAKFRAVLVRYKERTMLFHSAGKFSSIALVCLDSYGAEGVAHIYWCDAEDRDHHSENWESKWEDGI